jgi:hypothetical protein
MKVKIEDDCCIISGNWFGKQLEIIVPLETVTAAYVEANRDSEICPCKPCMESPKKYEEFAKEIKTVVEEEFENGRECKLPES